MALDRVARLASLSAGEEDAEEKGTREFGEVSVRILVITLAAIYGLGYLYAGWLVLRFLRVMWEVRQARAYAVFFAVLAPIGIAFYPAELQR